MKIETKNLAFSCLKAFSLVGAFLASALFAHAQCCVTIIPPTNSATINMSAPWAYDGDFSSADNPATFVDQVITAPPAVPPGTYKAWCIDVIDDVSAYPNNYNVSLFSSCDTNLNNEIPAGYPTNCYVDATTWHEINYLLNHKNGAGFWDVQNAIWYFVGGPDPSLGPPSYPAPDTNVINALVNDTLTNASNWVAQCGDVTAVIVAVNQTPLVQLTMLEVPCCSVSFTTIPTNTDLGCNPPLSSIPTCQNPVNTNLVNATSCCGHPVTITCSETDSSVDCKNFRILTYTATDGYGNSATASQTITWTVDTNLPVITAAPASTNLGCNPAFIPSDSTIKAQVTASALCSTPTINVTHVDNGSACGMTRVFTITATDACGNAAQTTVTYAWTINTTPPVITTVPTGTNYGCNPATLATDTNIAAQVTATASCGSAAILVTHVDSGSPCAMMRVFTITASDSCGNISAPAYVTNSWTVDTTKPVLSGQGSNITISCSASLVFTAPTATDNCDGHPTVTNTDVMTPGSCPNSYSVTRTWVATDHCGNVSLPVSQTITVVDTNAPVITCPPNVTILTNITGTNTCNWKPLYCTFTDQDWGGPCNNNPNWWNNTNCNWANWFTAWGSWCNSWTNYWSNCAGAKGTNNPFLCYNWLSYTSSNCWGLWNQNNIGSCWWLPCNGNNPGCILTNCFKNVYTNGCTIGWPGSNTYCVKFSTCDDVRRCLGFTGAPGQLNCNATNPANCNAGSFCSKVLALQLNCDISDCDNNNSGGLIGRCGDLVYCDPTSPCNGRKVRDICKIANCALGGGDYCNKYACNISISNLCDLVDKLNNCFESCQPSSWCTNHLTNQPVTAPPPSQTGYATASADCDAHPTVTYTDAQVAGPCSNSVEFIRTWKATDACGNSSYCQQTIILGNCSPITLACAGGSGQVGTPFSATLIVSNGVAPYKFSIASGSLPPGLTLNTNNGVISGNPTTPGTYSFTAQVTDSQGNSAISTCTAGCSGGGSQAWNFNAPTGTLGTSQTYTVNGLTITAYGFLNNGTPTALFGKNNGGDENGIGINGASDNEITTANFIQLDLGQAIAAGAQNATILINSVQSGEGYNIYGSNTKGVLGTLLISNGHTDDSAFAIPSFPNYRYISVQASVANVLLGAFSASIPSGPCSITIVAPPCTPSISGEVVRDCDGDGVIDAGEPGIKGVTVTLKKGSVTIATTTTDSNGNYTFSNVTNGTYTVSITQPSGCQVTYPANCNNQRTVTVANCQNVTGVNFAYTGTVKSIACYISCPQTAKCGQTITYTCTVTNTGTTCFNTCTVSTPNCGGWTYTCPTPLKPGDSCTFTKTYTCSYWDAGNLTCNATCYGWPNSGGCATGQGSCNTYCSRY